MTELKLMLEQIEDDYLRIGWQVKEEGLTYKVYWADRYTEKMEYKCLAETAGNSFTLKKSTHIPYYLKVSSWDGEFFWRRFPVLQRRE